MIVETRAADRPEAPLALRTVLQLDGDRMVLVDLRAISALSRDEKLNLVTRHGMAVRAESATALTGLHRALSCLRSTFLILFGASELASLWANIVLASGMAGIDWPGLLFCQLPCLALLLGRTLLPYGVRLLHAVTALRLSSVQKETSREVYARIVGEEKYRRSVSREIVPGPVSDRARQDGRRS